MNSLNSNNEPVIGTRQGWGKIALFAFAVLILGIMSKGCNDTPEQPHLFVINQHQ